MPSAPLRGRSRGYPILERADSAALLTVVSGLLNAWTRAERAQAIAGYFFAVKIPLSRRRRRTSMTICSSMSL
jgi:hypothetical protein